MQRWTKIVLSLLPATTAQINHNPTIRKMNERHLAEREARGAFLIHPINSMVYDTLVRLRNRGVVIRGEDGVYRKV